MPLFLLCVVLLFSCQKSSDLASAGEPSRIVQDGQYNEEILQISEDARDTLPGFFRQLARGRGAEHFCVKYPFTADDDSGVNMEHVWLTGIHFKNGIYYGILANTPRHLGSLKKGDTVTFNMDGITDWMYVRGGKIVGGDSIKYLLEKIPDYQRSEGERELLNMFN